MTRTLLKSACAGLALLAAACVGGSCGTGMATASAASVSPPSGYKKVSELVKLPDFLPGLGTLYVQPSTLPAGPFLGCELCLCFLCAGVAFRLKCDLTGVGEPFHVHGVG